MNVTTAKSLNLPSKEEFQQDVLATQFVLLHQAHFAFFRLDHSDSALWSLLTPKKPKPEGLGLIFGDPDLAPKDLGLTFEDVADMGIASNLMQLYDYGVLGLRDVSEASLDDCEGSAAWTSRILYDLRKSTFFFEWAEYAGNHYYGHVDRCLHVAELANARLLLEGGQEGFFLDDRDAGALTFRQLSLLSGFTEASLRTMVSRGDGPPIVKEGSSTYFEIAPAKEWLKAKGRYLAIRRVSDRGAAPLTERRFSTVEDFQAAMADRVGYLCNEFGAQAIDQRLAATGIKFKVHPLPDNEKYVEIPEDDLTNRELMTRLGSALDLPPELFALRAAEAVLTERLAAVGRELKQLSA